MQMRFYKFIILDESGAPIKSVNQTGTIAEHFTYCASNLIKIIRTMQMKEASLAYQVMDHFIMSLTEHDKFPKPTFFKNGENRHLLDLLKTTEHDSNYDIFLNAIESLKIPGVSSCKLIQDTNKFYHFHLMSKTPFEEIPLGTEIEHFGYCLGLLIDSLNGGNRLDELHEKELNEKINSSDLRTKLAFFLSYLQKHQYFSQKCNNITELKDLIDNKNFHENTVNLFLANLQKTQIPDVTLLEIFVDGKIIKIQKILPLKEIVIGTIIKNPNTFFSVKQLSKIPDNILDSSLKYFDPQRKLIIRVGKAVETYIMNHQITKECIEYNYLIDLLIAITKPNPSSNANDTSNSGSIKFNPYNNVNKSVRNYLEKTKNEPAYKISHIKKLNDELTTLLKIYYSDKEQGPKNTFKPKQINFAIQEPASATMDTTAGNHELAKVEIPTNTPLNQQRIPINAWNLEDSNNSITETSTNQHPDLEGSGWGIRCSLI